ncbi:alpha/beta fold hydrolase [Notoacmeibacter marinus]|uniref:alpha/beta fold hydrolase n=1 Tax=Notoacmeibacter marinus TaxID=1876515 RepID=UPI0013B0632E|nr:alpha/beta hydrolase [Notoacmeibacter marinus]
MLSCSFHDKSDAAPMILYLHGLGVAGWSWDPVIGALREYGAVVPDLPGHGGSCDTQWRSLDDTAARVAELVDSLPEDRPLHLAGHSLGAYVGLILLTLRQERFASAVLSGFHVTPPPRPNLLKLAYVVNGFVIRVPPLLRRFAAVFGDEAIQKRFVEGAGAISSRTIRRAGIQVVEFKPPAGLEALSLPLMSIAGEAEPEAIRFAPDRLSRQLPNVYPRILHGRDHMWPIKEPQTFADALRAHVSGQSETWAPVA